jgi:hypothetical protein
MTLENGSKELSHVVTQAHPGAGRPQGEGGRQAASCGRRLKLGHLRRGGFKRRHNRPSFQPALTASD